MVLAARQELNDELFVDEPSSCDLACGTVLTAKQAIMCLRPSETAAERGLGKRYVHDYKVARFGPYQPLKRDG